MIYQDDRTEEQKKTHTWLVIGTDRCLSGWGQAEGGTSVAAWACEPINKGKVLRWVSSRSDMLRVRELSELYKNRNYRPKGAAHYHIYIVKKGHPALE